MLEEIKEAGCHIEMTTKGHYLVLDKSDNPIEGFSVGHGSNKNMVNSPYVTKVRKALKRLEK